MRTLSYNSFSRQSAIIFALFIACASAGYGPIAQVASPSWNGWHGHSAVVAAPVAYASHWNGWNGAHYDGRWDGAWDHQGNWYNTHAHAAPLAYANEWAHSAPLAYAAHVPAHSATYKV